MTPVGEKSYLEHCIAALPAEKREAARHAFYEISETGDDSYLSKLLTVLEANGAYARKVPKEMTEAGAKVVREMEDVADQIAESEKYRRDAFQRTITEEAQRLANSLPVREINAGIVRQNGVLDHLQKAADKIDQGVSTGVSLFFALLAFVGGIALTGWFFWGTYTESRDDKSFCDAVANAGIQMDLKNTEGGSRFTLTGPPVTGTTGLARHGTATLCGVTVEFSKPQ
jgi:hypothetical protein